MKKFWKDCYDAMMTGIGYMTPVLVSGSLLMAIGKLMAGAADPGSMPGTLTYDFYTWGNMLFGCMNWVLAMYTAFRLGNRVAIPAGLLAGLFAANSPAGFLGAVVGGIFAGMCVRWLAKNLKLPASLNAAKGILIIPFISCFAVFVFMNWIIVPVCEWIVNILIGVLDSARSLSPFIFGGIMAVLPAIGMGSLPGRIAFAVAMIIMDETGSFMPITAMGASLGCMLGMAIALLVGKNKIWDEDDRQGWPNLVAGFICCVTETQIPYALKYPKHLFPALIIGSFIGGGLVYLWNLEVPVMHGGFLVVSILANNIPMYLVMTLIVTILTGVVWYVLTPNKGSKTVTEKTTAE